MVEGPREGILAQSQRSLPTHQAWGSDGMAALGEAWPLSLLSMPATPSKRPARAPHFTPHRMLLPTGFGAQTLGAGAEGQESGWEAMRQ